MQHASRGEDAAVGAFDDFEWVNAWALSHEAASDDDVSRARHEAQLAEDIAAIEQVRDRLSVVAPNAVHAAVSNGSAAPFRTADSTPVVLGSVIGSLMLVVFTCAAMFAKVVR